MKEKKLKLYFTSRLKGCFALQIPDCSIFWGSKAAFEAGRYVLIIWCLNDDTGFIINGPHPSMLPLPHNSPEWDWVLALTAFALFDFSVITPLFGDHTTSFMLSKEALELYFTMQHPHFSFPFFRFTVQIKVAARYITSKHIVYTWINKTCLYISNTDLWFILNMKKGTRLFADFSWTEWETA